MRCELCGHEHKDCGESLSLIADEFQLIRLNLDAVRARVDYWATHPELQEAVRVGHERLAAAVKEA